MDTWEPSWKPFMVVASLILVITMVFVIFGCNAPESDPNSDPSPNSPSAVE